MRPLLWQRQQGLLHARRPPPRLLHARRTVEKVTQPPVGWATAVRGRLPESRTLPATIRPEEFAMTAVLPASLADVLDYRHPGVVRRYAREQHVTLEQAEEAFRETLK